MYKSDPIKEISLQSNALLSTAMKLINKNAQGICFVLKGKKLFGILTDGDIRRAILKGFNLDTIISKVMRKNFCSMAVGSSTTDIQKQLKKFDFIPIVNEFNELVDYASHLHFHHIPLAKPILDGNELEYVFKNILDGYLPKVNM